LFLSALLNGLVAVPFMFLLMLISMNPAIVGKFQLPLYLRLIGWVATGFMAAAALAFIATVLQGFWAR